MGILTGTNIDKEVGIYDPSIPFWEFVGRYSRGDRLHLYNLLFPFGNSTSEHYGTNSPAGGILLFPFGNSDDLSEYIFEAEMILAFYSLLGILPVDD